MSSDYGYDDACRRYGPENVERVITERKAYRPTTGAACTCRRGVQRDNCPHCEGTGKVIDFAAIRARNLMVEADLFMVFVKPGVRYRKAAMPHSEVLMHMGIAGKPMDFEVLPSAKGYAPSAQLYEPGTDKKFSGPITHGEAGIYYHASKFHQRHHWHDGGYYYFYPNFPAAEAADVAKKLSTI